ncbi:hypothetical protein [Pseudomonas californiensis]|uniref:hypothetical protein n=2 Tax=Pseudomonas californiensis TaxID=2829823 RepID=UPI001E2DF1A9|nr:hypothetical protein [Pseudomonas californiensis]
MWRRAERYPLKTPLEPIQNPIAPPPGVRLLSEKLNMSVPNEHYLFFDNHGRLSIVRRYDQPDGQGPVYEQNDFPLMFLDWFAPAIREFRKPVGDRPTRFMSTVPEAVGDEMLTLERGMAVGGDDEPGYIVNNWSRGRQLTGLEGHFIPMSVAWTETFIFDGGLLKLLALAKSRL